MSLWLRYDLTVRGSDSAIHNFNDSVVLKLSEIHIYNDAARPHPPPMALGIAAASREGRGHSGRRHLHDQVEQCWDLAWRRRR